MPEIILVMDIFHYWRNWGFLIFFTLFFSDVYATQTTITTTSAQNFSNTTSSDLNAAYSSCQAYVTNPVVLSSQPNIECLWFAIGDVIQTYSPSNDRVFLVTVSTGQEGWYRVNRFVIQPTPIIEGATWDDQFYLGEFFDLSFPVFAYRATVLSDVDDKTDYRSTYQGFRDYLTCPDNDNTDIYKTYNGQQVFDIGGVGDVLVETDPFLDIFDNASNIVTNKSHCTDPTIMGVSCRIDSTFFSPVVWNSNGSAPADLTYGYSFVNNQARCDTGTRQSSVARQFLTGETVPNLNHEVLPDLYRNSSLLNVYQSPNVNPIDKFIPSNFYIFHLDNFDPTLDSDDDGTPDIDDAFPNDPNEDTDTDGDGVGDNGDPDPNDPDNPVVGGGGTGGGTGGGDTGGGGTGGGDTGGGDTGGGDDTGTGTSTTSGSCDVAPVCTGDALQCAIIIQTWESACINNDDSSASDHTIENSDYETTAISFTTRVSNSPIVQSFSNAANVIAFGSGTCPPFSIDLSQQIGVVASTSIHCDLFTSIAGTLSVIMLAVYSFLGFKILASA